MPAARLRGDWSCAFGDHALVHLSLSPHKVKKLQRYKKTTRRPNCYTTAQADVEAFIPQEGSDFLQQWRNAVCDFLERHVEHLIRRQKASLRESSEAKAIREDINL